MQSERRKFIKDTGLTGMSLAASTHLIGQSFNTVSGRQPSVRRARDFTEYHNEKMAAAWQSALDILKPSARALERGLALHRESVVFDTYGFMPRAAVDGEIIARAVEGGASELEINDLREDHSMTRFVKNEREKAEFERAWKASGVTCVFQNAGEESNSVKVLLKRLARFTYATDSLPNIVGKAVRTSQVMEAHQEGKQMLYFSGNGVPMPLDLISLEDELRYIIIFYQLGIRMMHLTYNRRNLIGDGCGEETDAGLSDFGRAVVREMNRVGVLVDVAHSGWQTGLDAAKLSDKPVVASHTTVAEIHHHIRSKPDHLIRAIADTGGYIGICCIPRFLGGSGDIAALLRHIDYVVKKFGPDYVGIGTDVSYISSYASEENRKIPSYRRSRTRWEALWPDDPFKTTAKMTQSIAWTNWPLFTVGMVQLGYSDDTIRKILGGNAMRVLDLVAV